MSDTAQLYSWVLTAIGLTGFYLAGKRVWWSWYINIANQIVWFFYALYTEQWGFLAGVAVYTAVFVKNSYEWTRDREEFANHPWGKVKPKSVDVTQMLTEVVTKDPHLEEIKSIPYKKLHDFDLELKRDEDDAYARYTEGIFEHHHQYLLVSKSENDYFFECVVIGCDASLVAIRKSDFWKGVSTSS